MDIAITESGQELLKTPRSKLPIHYAQGPLLAPGNRPDIDDYEVVATCQTEIAKNGAPKGVMTGTTTVAKGSYGRGRVVCFRPHPEMTQGLQRFIPYGISLWGTKRLSSLTHTEDQPGKANVRSCLLRVGRVVILMK